jgi:ApaG protein
MPQADKKYEISISPQSQYLADQSDEPAGRFVFAYTITLRNTGSISAQLISRHWIITDATGHTEEVKGPGVVGEQPVLAPGESFQYTSGCPLKTSSGLMRGTYQMVTEDGDHFDIEIAPFALHEPYTIH